MAPAVSFAQARTVHCSERVLATARALVAILFLAAGALSPHMRMSSPVASASVIAYASYSFLLLIALHANEQYGRNTTYLVHVADLIWPALLIAFTDGPGNPFLLVYIFVLFAAAFRWGLQATMLTLVAAVSVLSSQAMLASHAGPNDGDGFRLVVRVSYLVLTALLAGYLGEKQKEARHENAALARLIRKAHNDGSFREALTSVVDELLRLFSARRAVVVFEDSRAHTVFICDTAAAGGLHWRELHPDERATYLFSIPPGAVAAVNAGVPLRTLQLAAEGTPVVRQRSVWPKKFMAAHPFKAALAAGFSSGTWKGRIYLFDGRTHSHSRRELRLLLRIANEVAPAVQNTYLLRRLRKDAAAGEREKLARTLHDGVVQCLFGLEMRILVLRKRHTAHQALAEELTDIQRLLHEQLLELRELIQGAKTLEVTPDRLVPFIAETVERFRRDTEISAHFQAEADTLSLSAAQCGELSRIVQEALVNIRKHSGARAVLVRLDTDDRHELRLVIEDDGGGLDFSGRHTLAELEAAHQGPAIIKDRVRSMGADLVIESFPWRGTRVEITVPQEAYAAHAPL